MELRPSSSSSPSVSENPMHPSGAPLPSLLAAWEETLLRAAERPAIYSPAAEVLRSFREIEEEARQWQGAFAGLQQGSVIAIQPGNHPSWPALFLAALRCGLVTLPLGRHIGAAERTLALETCHASALVEQEEGAAPGHLRLVALGRQAVQWPGPVPDLLKLTSGTTSAPRAIRVRQAQLLEDCLQICETMGIGEGDLNYAVIPLAHSYGFSNLVTPLLCKGVPMVVSDDRMPRAILDGLSRTGATVFPGMPVFFDKFAALAAIATFGDLPPLPRLRLCISAGAPLTPEVGERFTAKFGLRVHTFYGSSECGGIAYDGSEAGGYREGAVGFPMSRVKILPAGGEGTIVVEGPAVADGYWPEQQGEAGQNSVSQLANGRFIPADLVHLTPGGLILSGRVSDLINVAGRKLNPREVEARLLECPGVREAVVFGIASTLRHEDVVACVAGEVQAAEVLRFARGMLSGWQTPREIWVVPEIPRNERGKINRRELAQRYGAMRHSLPQPVPESRS